MKDKILKLCKRLKKCSLDELVQFLEEDTSQVESIINDLITDGFILFINGYYFAQDKPTPKIESHYLNMMLEYISDEKFDLIIRCFCLGIPVYKVEQLLNIGTTSSTKYYDVFRSFIYNRQLAELKKLYSEKPQRCRTQIFFEKPIYLYIYNYKVYATDIKLFSDSEEIFTHEEILSFKKIYSYLSRLKSHNKNAKYLEYKIAEALWRREKTFDELYADLKNNLIS